MSQGPGFPVPPPCMMVWSGGLSWKTFIFLWFSKDFEGNLHFPLVFHHLDVQMFIFLWFFKDFVSWALSAVRGRFHFTKSPLPTPLRKRCRYVNGMLSAIRTETEGIHWFFNVSVAVCCFPLVFASSEVREEADYLKVFGFSSCLHGLRAVVAVTVSPSAPLS